MLLSSHWHGQGKEESWNLWDSGERKIDGRQGGEQTKKKQEMDSNVSRVGHGKPHFGFFCFSSFSSRCCSHGGVLFPRRDCHRACGFCCVCALQWRQERGPSLCVSKGSSIPSPLFLRAAAQLRVWTLGCSPFVGTTPQCT